MGVAGGQAIPTCWPDWQTDLIRFLVDCLGHDAANAVKSLCRQGGKRLVALRSTSITSLLAALQTAAAAGLSDAAD